jgi:hypothetical protein
MMTRDDAERHAAEIAKRQYFLARGLVFREPDEPLVAEDNAEYLRRWYRLVAMPLPERSR